MCCFSQKLTDFLEQIDWFNITFEKGEKWLCESVCHVNPLIKKPCFLDQDRNQNKACSHTALQSPLIGMERN